MLRTKLATSVRAAGQNPRAVISTDTLDDQKDVIVQTGLSFRPRLRVTFAHNYEALPVGVVERVFRYPKQTEAEWRWLENDEFADRVQNAFLQDALDASIGFTVEEAERNEHGGYNILRATVIEFALTPVPANAEAVAILKRLQLPHTTPTWAPSGDAIIAASDVEIAQCMRTIREELVTALHAHARGPRMGRLIEGSVQRGIDRLRGRIADEPLTVEIADVPPRGPRSAGPAIEIDASPAEINAMLAEVARETMANLDARIARAVTATINRLRGRID